MDKLGAVSGARGPIEGQQIGDLVLITGVTGYVGARLPAPLLREGFGVRVLVRDPTRLPNAAWVQQVDTCVGDVLDGHSLAKAMVGVRFCYYLIHGMGGGPGFHDRDLEAAKSFGKAALAAGVERVIYLGGLGDPDSDLSEHLRSRQETGAVLTKYGPPVTEFRAAVIVGSGSTSFEMIRYLTERLPIMICPSWVATKVQPIGIEDMLAYLVEALTVPGSAGTVVEVGGADVLTYGSMMQEYARLRGLRRWLVSVPVLTPRLSSYWVHLITPLQSAVAQPLIEGLRNEVVVRDGQARLLFPGIHPIPYGRSVEKALENLTAESVEAETAARTAADDLAVVANNYCGMIIDRRRVLVGTPPEFVYKTFVNVGGDSGWYHADLLWRIRGMVDRLLGGVGMRRKKARQEKLAPGDELDFWRVEVLKPGRMMRLRAEMKLPGGAWLQFEAWPVGGGTLLEQTAFFAPRGLPGLAYWWLLYPIHVWMFGKLMRAVAQRSVADFSEDGDVS